MIEQIVNLAVDYASREAESVLVERFRTISLGELNRLFDARHAVGHGNSVTQPIGA